MFEFQFKDIPENGSFAGKTVSLPTPTGDKQTKIDTLPEEFILIEGEDFIRMYEEWKALPLYKRFFIKLKEFWNRRV